VGLRAVARRSRTSTALLVGVALVSAACGARVGPYLGAGGAAGSQVGAGSGSGPGASGSGGATQTGSGPVSQSGPTAAGNGGKVIGAPASSGPAVPASQLTPANFPYSPAQQAALCPGAAGNTASDVGVTSTTITLGNVSGLTGILANNFEQGSEAVQALFSAINAAGGICGRQLKLLVEDDGQDAGKNAADIADEIPKVFAFVGSLSDGDNGGVQEMVNAKVPDIGVAINPNRGVSPVYWSTNGSTYYVVNGHPEIYNSFTNGLKALAKFPTKIATLSYSIPISASAGQEFQNLFVHEGAQNCFTDFSVSPATASLDQDVIEMKQRGCDGVFTTMDVTGNAKLLQAMQRQGFHPVYEGTTFDGYTPAQIEVAGQDTAQNFEAVLPFIPFTDNQPEVNLYQQMLQTYEPGKQPSGFGIESWASAEMFIYALIKAGHNPTRNSLTQILQSIDSWDTGGATAPITPRMRLPAGPCTMDVIVRGNNYVRKWPASGFFCNGQLVPVG